MKPRIVLTILVVTAALGMRGVPAFAVEKKALLQLRSQAPQITNSESTVSADSVDDQQLQQQRAMLTTALQSILQKIDAVASATNGDRLVAKQQQQTLLDLLSPLQTDVRAQLDNVPSMDAAAIDRAGEQARSSWPRIKETLQRVTLGVTIAHAQATVVQAQKNQLQLQNTMTALSAKGISVKSATKPFAQLKQQIRLAASNAAAAQRQWKNKATTASVQRSLSASKAHLQQSVAPLKQTVAALQKASR